MYNHKFLADEFRASVQSERLKLPKSMLISFRLPELSRKSLEKGVGLNI